VTWVKQDDRELENKKVRKVSDSAYRFHAAARGRSSQNLADGHVPAGDVVEIGMLLKPQRRTERACARLIDELVDAVMWHRAGEVCDRCVAMRIEKQVTEPLPTSGWLIHDYLEYNPPGWKVREEKDEARRRMALRRAGRSGERTGERAGERSGEHGASSGERSGEVRPFVRGARPVPSRPQVRSTRTTSSALRAREAGDAAAKAAGHARRTGLRPIGTTVARVVGGLDDEPGIGS